MLKKQVKNLIGCSFLLHVSLLRVWGSCRAWATCQRAEEETFFRLSRLTSCRGRVNESRLLMSTVCFGKTGSRRRKGFRSKAWKSSQSWRGGLVPEPSQSQNSQSWNAYTRRDFVSLWNSSVENQRIFLFFVVFSVTLKRGLLRDDPAASKQTLSVNVTNSGSNKPDLIGWKQCDRKWVMFHCLEFEINCFVKMIQTAFLPLVCWTCAQGVSWVFIEILWMFYWIFEDFTFFPLTSCFLKFFENDVFIQVFQDF